MAVKFVAASKVTTDLLGMKESVEEIGVRVVNPVVMHEDNKTVIRKIQGEYSAGRIKHIAVRLKFIHDYSQKEVIKVDYCESRFMRADILTKTFAAPRLNVLRNLVSLVC